MSDQSCHPFPVPHVPAAGPGGAHAGAAAAHARARTGATYPSFAAPSATGFGANEDPRIVPVPISEVLGILVAVFCTASVAALLY